MADHSAIEWTDATWSPTLGCTRVSPACDHCYAIRTVHRMASNPHPAVAAAAAGLTMNRRPGLDWTGQVRTLPDRLDLPLRWRKPRRIFVDSQSDLFHDQVPDDFIARVFASMALTRRHTFQVLTKRHARMRSLLAQEDFRQAVAEHATDLMCSRMWQRWQVEVAGRLAYPGSTGDGWTVTKTESGINLWSPPWPLPNVWLGVSVEDQKRADLRIPALLVTPAAVRFLSCEPLLGPVDLARMGPRRLMSALAVSYDQDTGVPRAGVDWVIVGGESGSGARPMHPDWARQLRDACVDAVVPFLFKQWGGRTAKAGGRDLDGHTWDQYPAAAD